MANYLSSRTGAQIDTVLDNADAGNIGKVDSADFSGDVNIIMISGFTRVSSSATNIPVSESGGLLTTSLNANNTVQLFHTRNNKAYVRGQNNLVWTAWQELYHTGNTGVVSFNKQASPVLGTETLDFSPFNNGQINFSRIGTTSKAVCAFYNANGSVGDIKTSGTATSYNTSSDPRLKEFAAAPTDGEINAEFDSLFSCFRTFKWKTDLTGDLVWGFDAWKAIDSGLGFGSEGEGPRELPLGAVYETIPAVTESKVVLDADGNPTSEIEQVVITEAIDKKVSPAGVDQSKAVPVLLAKIEQLERRLTAAGL